MLELSVIKRRIDHQRVATITGFIVLVLILAGCGSRVMNKVYRSSSSGGYGEQASDYSDAATRRLADYDTPVGETVRLVKRQPWESWPFNRDLKGRQIRNAVILEGDEYLKRGYARQALERYRLALKDPLSSDSAEALIMRISSTELLLEQPEKALVSMSDFFRKEGKIVDDVDLRFSLLFAYAYGYKGDLEQSIAWFSRVYREADGRGGMADLAVQGLALLLRSLPSSSFEEAAARWSTDLAVNRQVSKERLRRTGVDFIEPETKLVANKFWEIQSTRVAEVKPVSTAVEGAVSVGVLLPLSGKFSTLGTSTKNGVDLAMLGQRPEIALTPVYKDTKGDVTTASAGTRELLADQDLSALIGPLLSSASTAASNIIRQNRLSTIVFSKSSGFETGDGIFRLGPTIDSQVMSLLDVCFFKLGYVRFALVTPADPLGEEYGDVFRAYALQLGVDVVYEAKYYPGDDNALVTIAQELEESKAQAIFLPDSLQVAGRLSGNLSEKSRRRMRLLGSARWDNAKELANSRTVLDKAIFVSPFFAGSERPVVSQFIKAYQSRYNEQPDFLAAQGFDAATLVAAAMKRHTRGGIKYIDALTSIRSYEGLTGEIEVGSDGEIRRKFAVVQLQRGQLIEIVSPDRRSAAAKTGAATEGSVHVAQGMTGSAYSGKKPPLQLRRGASKQLPRRTETSIEADFNG